MFTLRILNITRPHNISSDHTTHYHLSVLDVNVARRVVLRPYGVSEWRSVGVTCCAERERRLAVARRATVSECWEQLNTRLTGSDLTQPRPPTRERENQSQQSRSNRGGYKENIVWYHYWYYDLRYTLHYTRHCYPSPSPPPPADRNLDKNRIQL